MYIIKSLLALFLIAYSTSSLSQVDVELRGSYTVNSDDVHATLKLFRDGSLRYQLNAPELAPLNLRVDRMSAASISESGRVLFVNRYNEDFGQYSEIYLNGVRILQTERAISSRTSFVDRHAVAFQEGDAHLRVVRFSDDGEYDSQLIDRVYRSQPDEIDQPLYSPRSFDFSLEFTPDLSMIYTSFDVTQDVSYPPSAFHYAKLDSADTKWKSVYLGDTSVRSSAVVGDDRFFILTGHNNIMWNESGVWRQAQPQSGLNYFGIYQALEPGYFIGIVTLTKTFCVLDQQLIAKVCITNDTENTGPLYRQLNERYINGVQFLNNEILLRNASNPRYRVVDVTEYFDS